MCGRWSSIRASIERLESASSCASSHTPSLHSSRPCDARRWRVEASVERRNPQIPLEPGRLARARQEIREQCAAESARVRDEQVGAVDEHARPFEIDIRRPRIGARAVRIGRAAVRIGAAQGFGFEDLDDPPHRRRR